MTSTKDGHLKEMTLMQERLSGLAEMWTGQNTDQKWPFCSSFDYFVITGDTITASSTPDLRVNTKTGKAFGVFDHSEGMIGLMHSGQSGTGWIRKGVVKDRYSLAWHAYNGHITGIISPEETLLEISGYHLFKVMLMLSAFLASALLLLFLIWALSWLRITAVHEQLNIKDTTTKKTL
ncbi:MAG: hypothetical protein U9P80_02365 [Thermodesulfobacteriota bacterium]|nr:hypothetical protein [Thermodesulfobacteriota bacterium]